MPYEPLEFDADGNLVPARRQPAAPAKPPPDGKRQAPKNPATAARFQVLNAFTDFDMAHRTRAEIACWLVLYRDTRNGTARTSVDDLARRAGCHRRQVLRALRVLEAEGLVRVIHRGGLRSGPSRYQVCGGKTR